MPSRLGLNLIQQLLTWDDERATEEFSWLRLMSELKYDGYSDYLAGSRFVEALSIWLRQFEPQDRETAYQFVRNRLVYISIAEMNRLVEAFVPEHVTPRLRRAVADEEGVRAHEVWASEATATAYQNELRRTLFVGLSDGSRIDVLRRANPTMSPDQFVPMMHIDDAKWRDLSKELRGSLDDPTATFGRVVLVDDFTASGTTFIRKVDGNWKGKLWKFKELVKAAREALGSELPLAEIYDVHIHHHVSTGQARRVIEERVARAREQWTDATFGDVLVSEGMRLSDEVPLDDTRDAAFLELCRKHYNGDLHIRLGRHVQESGLVDLRRGYGGCALPLVLEHNTPNNSVPLVWAWEEETANGPKMRPLFRRRDRHGN